MDRGKSEGGRRRGGAEERERRKERGDGEGEGDRKFMKNRVNLAVVDIERRRSLSSVLVPIFAYGLNIYDTSYHECILFPPVGGTGALQGRYWFVDWEADKQRLINR